MEMVIEIEDTYRFYVEILSCYKEEEAITHLLPESCCAGEDADVEYDLYCVEILHEDGSVETVQDISKVWTEYDDILKRKIIEKLEEME